MEKVLVQKRNGDIVPFDEQKIKNALTAAFIEVDNNLTDYTRTKINNITNYIKEKAASQDKPLHIEEIQDMCENGLMNIKCKDVARAYIRYRYKRQCVRGNSTDEDVIDLLGGNSEYWNDENSNKNAKVVTVQRDYLAGITSTDIAKRFLLPSEVLKAHDAGAIHQHDMDYMAQMALHNCCLINLEDTLQNGTVINGVQIDTPHRLITATTIATQIITAVASSQYGGCTISVAHLAPFVRKSYKFYLNKYKNRGFSDVDCETYAKEDLKKEISDAVQTFNYQVNSMSTTNGQAPFLSVFMQIDEDPEYEEENYLLIEEFLNQRILGMKNEKGIYITQAFPKLLYVLDENNAKENSKYWELTKLAAKCTAKRMVPDYISAKKMREWKINKFGQGDVYGCMGCRSFLTPDQMNENYAKAKNYDPNKGKYYGRFNCGVTTVNLAYIALESEKNFDKFWELFEKYTELCHKGLQARINRLEQVTSDIAPILWQHGALARLEKGEKLHDLLHHGYSTASLGYAGLYECVKYMTGKSHMDDAEGQAFALEVMQKLNDKCNQWKVKENIDYSLYGSPIESTTYKFAKALKKRFGDDVFIKLDGKDRNYITNSYHYAVFEEIDAFTKLSKEAQFQRLSPGGNISYVEVPNLNNNIDAVLELIKFIYENIMYAELNTKSDYCQVCGFDGEIEIVEKDNKLDWRCPQCGNMDHSKMNIVRRTCGYLGSNYWNQGRTQEIRERVLHL